MWCSNPPKAGTFTTPWINHQQKHLSNWVAPTLWFFWRKRLRLVQHQSREASKRIVLVLYDNIYTGHIIWYVYLVVHPTNRLGGLVHPSYLRGVDCPHFSHWNNQGWFTHKNDERGMNPTIRRHMLRSSQPLPTSPEDLRWSSLFSTQQMVSKLAAGAEGNTTPQPHWRAKLLELEPSGKMMKMMALWLCYPLVILVAVIEIAHWVCWFTYMKNMGISHFANCNRKHQRLPWSIIGPSGPSAANFFEVSPIGSCDVDTTHGTNACPNGWSPTMSGHWPTKMISISSGFHIVIGGIPHNAWFSSWQITENPI